jgi:hypothetical protein
MDSVSWLQPVCVAHANGFAISLAVVDSEQVSAQNHRPPIDRGATEWLLPAASVVAELSFPAMIEDLLLPYNHWFELRGDEVALPGRTFIALVG